VRGQVSHLRAAVLTAGCRLNQAESDALRQRLTLEGATLVEAPEQADVCYVNTCTVTAEADRSSLGLIRRVCRSGPAPRVVVLGCLAERAPERLRQVPGVSEVWDNARKQARIAGLGPIPARSRALLKVQDGCPYRCSFCVVSGLRGPPWALPAHQVRQQLARLVADGFREVVLTGLNLGTYRDGATTLAGLVRGLLAFLDRARLRLGPLEPDTVDDALVCLLAEPGVCPHLHLPLQSGDDDLLARMNRRYRVEEFELLLERVLRVRPETNIGVDVIVGFPGESDKSYERTWRLLARLPIGYLHVFPFSLRPGTEPACAGEPVPKAKVRERVGELRALSDRRRREYAARFVDSVRPAMVETAQAALTDNYLRLKVVGGEALAFRSLARLRIGRQGSVLTGSPD